MKKFLGCILTVILLVSSMAASVLPVFADKAVVNRNIAIVFDNSGSMYVKGEKAWCRATYAMEVFASMLNKGDSLYIHPMNPIEVKGKQYTMDSPFIITDPSQSSQIREIYTEKAGDTHIETIDSAIKQLSAVNSNEKYLIVLTDGQVFYEGGKELSTANTVKKLAERFKTGIGENLNILYLGIGSQVAMPSVDSEYYLGEKASDSKDVLSGLTRMCNRIFARDVLPASHVSNKTINFDISLSKLIVFVQGENVSNLKISGKNGAKATYAGGTKTQYSSVGAGNYKKDGESSVDKSLQGMLVTYTDCNAGQYEISYSGNASNIEIYYEPDADLDFIFTDEKGNLADSESLYKGEYKVQFGLKDAKTGELISSDLIGDPVYQGKYIINGKEYAISHSGKSGETPVTLDVGDTFSAQLTASYLNGYSITKTASDFGWPDGSIKVSAHPAGDVSLEITGENKEYDLKNLEKGGTYTAKVYYKGQILTGSELEKVDLKWDPDKSNVEIKKTLNDDHYELSLHYKNPNDPLSTQCGKCTVTIYAYYTADGCAEAKGQAPLTYTVEDKVVTPNIKFELDQTHYQISKLDKSKSIKAHITLNGKKLTPEEFATVKFTIDTEGIGYKIIPLPEQSAYEIKLNSSENVKKGKYNITASVVMEDSLGRELTAKKSCKIKLSNLPLWLEWLIIILVIIILIAIIYYILHIRKLPTKLNARKKDCEMNVGGEDVTKTTSFNAAIEGGTLVVEAKYAGNKTGVRMSVQPGTDSYLKTKQVKRKAMVEATSVKKSGTATIEDVTIGTKKYVLNSETYRLEPAIPGTKNFDLSNGNTITYSGTMQLNGVDETFYVRVKLNFRKN